MKKRKWEKGISLRMVLSVAFSPLSMGILIFVGTFINHTVSEHFVEMALGYNEQLTSQVKENLDTHFENINETLMSFARNRELLTVVSNDENMSSYERYTAVKNVQTSMNALITTQEDIRRIFAFSDKGKVYVDDSYHAPNYGSAFLQDLLNSYKTTKYMKVIWYPVMEPTYYSGSALYQMEPEIPVSLVIRDTGKYDVTNQGVILASLSTGHVDEIFSEIKNNGGLMAFIVDENDTIYYSSDSSYIGMAVQTYVDDHDMKSEENGLVFDSAQKMVNIVSTQDLDVNGWRLMVLSDLEGLNRQLDAVQYMIFTVILAAIFLMMGISWFVSAKVTKPLMQLTNDMNHVNGSAREKLKKKQPFREIQTLYDSYNEMNTRIETLINQVYHVKLRQKEAQYEALQSKINPHFLYNTLQTIHSLAVLERNEDVELVTAALGEMLEYLVYEKDSQVYLEQEMNYVNSYIRIQKIRFNDSFSVHINVTEEACRCVMHKLMVQPIVENAINHGLGEKEEGILELTAWVGEGILTVVVRDNGKGMDEQTLESLMKHVRSQNRESKHKSIGLPNIQERLVLKYGPRYGLTIKSEPDEGTEVTLRMPAITEKNVEET